MDVHRQSFTTQFLDILEDLVRCHFVAIDLELSGIPQLKGSKPSLQKRYTDLKAAAEQYHVLQVGLTLAIHDQELNQYVLKPYNITLNPAIEEKLDIDRDFTFSSSAVEFLSQHNFDFSNALRNGIPFLSHAEETDARKTAYTRLEQKVDNIYLDARDEEALELFQDLRKEIIAWKADKEEELYVVAHDGAQDGNKQRIARWKPNSQAPSLQLSRYEKRLIHQLLRTEFPDLISFGGNHGCITIKPLDSERERQILKRKKRAVDHQIRRQTGFRWIVDALTGKSLMDLDIADLTFTGERHLDEYRYDYMKSRLHRVRHNLMFVRPILMGHNCMLDFVYFYHAFIGPLPDSVQQFEERVHAIFPMVVDTKYLATYGCGDIAPSSSLAEIAKKVTSFESLKIEVPSAYAKYTEREAFHEAGFDSYLTAVVGIKISTKMAADFSSSSLSDGFEAFNVTSNSDGGLTQKPEVAQIENSVTNTSGTDGDTADGSETSWRALQDDNFKPHEEEMKSTNAACQAIPPWNSAFWHTYGNRFRVFGTLEGVANFDIASEQDVIPGDSTVAKG